MDVEHVPPITGRTTSKHVVVEGALWVMHASSQPSTVIVAATADVHRDHHDGQIDRRSGGWGRRSFHTFLFSVPLDVLTAWMVQRTRFDVEVPFGRSNRFPHTGAVFSKPHGEALHFGTCEQAEVRHFPPSNGAGQGDVVQTRLDVPSVLSVGPGSAQVGKANPEDGHRFATQRGQTVGVGQFTKQQEWPALVEGRGTMFSKQVWQVTPFRVGVGGRKGPDARKVQLAIGHRGRGRQSPRGFGRVQKVGFRQGHRRGCGAVGPEPGASSVHGAWTGPRAINAAFNR